MTMQLSIPIPKALSGWMYFGEIKALLFRFPTPAIMWTPPKSAGCSIASIVLISLAARTPAAQVSAFQSQKPPQRFITVRSPFPAVTIVSSVLLSFFDLLFSSPQYSKGAYAFVYTLLCIKLILTLAFSTNFQVHFNLVFYYLK